MGPPVRARPRIIRMVKARPSAAMATTAQRTDRLPSRPIMKVAIGGPATHAKEKIARVFMMPDTEVPTCFWCAKSRPIPTPAGPPSATSARTAIGRLMTRARAVASAMVRPPHQSRGRR